MICLPDHATAVRSLKGGFLRQRIGADSRQRQLYKTDGKLQCAP
jgi:hypothetical protein